MNKKIKVINITGWGRNGSTILGKILGEIEGCFFAGEIRNIWNKVLVENRLCGCGVPFKECKLWESVFSEAFNGFDNLDAQGIKKLSRQYDKSKSLPLIFFPAGRKFINSHLSSYINNQEKLFEAMKAVTGAKVIIDSSKSPFYGYLLTQVKNIDLYFIHLIRDPRGIAFSRQKKLIQPDKTQTMFMEKHDSFSSALLWNLRNLTSEKLCSNLREKSLLIHYSDFIKNPKAAINTILELIDEHPSKLPFISDDEVTLGTNHSVWGNPVRFQNGIVKLKLDEEWKEKLNKKDKMISTLVTLPFLIRYGYSLKF